MTHVVPSDVHRSRRHWIVFGAAFAILLGAAGTRSAAGVLVDPLHDEFGWSHGTIGFAVSINVLLYGFIGPFAAALQQRFGIIGPPATLFFDPAGNELRGERLIGYEDASAFAARLSRISR